MNENEFTIRVTGAAPPPLPSTSSSSSSSKKKGGRGRGGKAKNKATAQSQQQQQRRYNLRLRPSTSLHQLRTDVYALFNIPSDNTNSYQISFLGGFPPTELDQTDKQTVHELGIRPNESYKVVFALIDDASAAVASAKQDAAAVAGKKSNGESSSAIESLTTTGRQKRASAMAATANFKDVIAAQDAIMKNEKKKSPKKNKSTSVIAGGTNSNIAGFGKANNASKRIATIGGGNNKAKKVKIEGGGYRLSDGKAFAGTSPSKKKKAASDGEAMFKSEDDVANKLLTSLSSGGGNVGKYLRTAMKGAVTKSYEASRAAVRVAAVNTGDYSFEKVKGGSVVDGGGVVLGTAKDHAGDTTAGEGEVDEDLGRTLYTVSYSKGMEGRGRYDEQVEIIGLAALKSVLKHVYDSSNNESGGEDGSGENKDGRLRPVLIAQLSPRAFWSLVYHCSSEATQSPTANISVEDMLRSTLPQLDWSHLERGGRKRVLSEKAKENLRQTTTEPTAEESLQNNGIGEQNAIEELGESILNAAMAGDEVDHGQELSERELMARAAMARFGSENGAMQSAVTSSPVREEPNVDNWMLVTPTDDDIDELVECITEGAVTSEQYDEDTAKTWSGILLDNIQNWRVLANCNTDDIISKLTGKDCPQPSSDIVQEWIDAAQVHTMEEIMLEILGGDQDALDLLQDKAKSCSPRDLVQWRDAPGMLADTLSSADETSSNWKRSDVMRWISRAEIALGVCTWLEDYTSHVKES